MNIAKLNPIGYQTKTEKGNTYKKSNLGTSIGLVGGVALTAAAETTKNPKLEGLTVKGLIKSIAPKAKILENQKAMKAITAASIVADGLFWAWTGNEADKIINKKRVEKANSSIGLK